MITKLLFLLSESFRGLFREGKNGYNVPYGHYKNIPNIIDKENLLKVQELIKDVEFNILSFEESFKNINDVGDFVYLDPPYAPENDKSSITS